jgi:predicted nucleic acid-binding protein
VVYLDSSAIVKLVLHEAESLALRAFLDGHPKRSSCGLARTEVLRTVGPSAPGARERARRVVATLDLMQLDDALLDAAGELEGDLRSLDASHVAAARTLGQDLECLVTYDHRMAAAAESLGMMVVAPS